MSLLFPEDDGILEEMFALIDSSDVGSDKDSDASVTRKPAPAAPPRRPRCTAKANPAKPKKKRIRRPETSSTAFQRRKKAEIIALREEAQVLESRLENLKQKTDLKWEKSLPRVELGKESSMGEISWAEEAVKEYRLRTEAEELNHTLKGLWANQFHMNNSIRAMLQRRSVLHGMDFVFDSAPNAKPVNKVRDVDMWQLEELVDGLYLQTDAVVRPENPLHLSSTANIKQDERRGKIAQFHNTTPLGCPLEKARDFIWSDFQQLRTPGQKPNTLERKFTMTLTTKAGVLQFDRLHSLSRYMEKDRFVIVCSDVMTLPSYGLRFRSEGWLVVSRSVSHPNQACAARNVKQLFLDEDVGSGTCTDGIGLVKEIALETLMANYREYVNGQQQRLVQFANQAGAQEAASEGDDIIAWTV